MKPKLAFNKFWLFFAVLFIFLRLPSLFEPNWYGDEAIYLVLGQAVRKGLTLYSQIHDNKPPTLYYLAALSPSVFAFRLLLLTLMIPTIYFFYKLALKFFNVFLARFCLLVFTILTCIPLIEGNISNAEIFMLLPTIYAFYILNPQNLISIIFSGLSLGFAFTIKMPSLLDAFAIILLLFISAIHQNKPKKIYPKVKQFVFRSIIFFVSFLIPTILWAAFFATKSALLEFMQAAIYQNIPYLSSWATKTHTSSAFQSGLPLRLVLMLFSCIVSLLLFFKKKLSLHQTLVLVWLSTSLFSCLLSERPYPHYIILIVPAFCLGLTFFLKNLKSSFSLLFIVWLLAAVISFIKYDFYFYRNRGYYKAFYLNLNDRQVFVDHFGNHVSRNQKIVSYLSKYSPTDNSVFVWGDSPFIYSDLNILPPLKYTVAYHIVDFSGYQTTMDALKISLPSFIVYYPMSDRPFTDLDQFIGKFYFLDNQIDNVLIYQKR